MLNYAQQTGGKEDGAQGVGTNTDKLQDALVVARSHFEEFLK